MRVSPRLIVICLPLSLLCAEAALGVVRSPVDRSSGCIAHALTIHKSEWKYLATDPEEPDLAAEGVMDEKGDLRIGIYAKRQDGSRSPTTRLRGSTAFAEIMNHFGARVRRVEADLDPYSDIMQEFNVLTAQGVSPQKAAMMTWFGRQCSKYGYTRVSIESLQGSRGRYVFADFFFSEP